MIRIEAFLMYALSGNCDPAQALRSVLLNTHLEEPYGTSMWAYLQCR
ncbi:hypothetical protein [Paenibacillus foliorum]|nr:hypothetical protein [Paenibacillus foliorum]